MATTTPSLSRTLSLLNLSRELSRKTAPSNRGVCSICGNVYDFVNDTPTNACAHLRTAAVYFQGNSETKTQEEHKSVYHKFRFISKT